MAEARAGVITWRGPSQITGDEIAVVLTGLFTPSANSKTGPMVQAYIVPTTVNAGKAVSTPAERAVCGDCALRGDTRKERLCYVTYGVWVVGRHMEQGSFKEVKLREAIKLLAGKALRIGAYGDPAAVPFHVWKMLLKNTTSWTGYTHQWRSCDPKFKELVMASCETEEGADEAAAAGWRVYRIRFPNGPLKKSEIICPYEAKGVTCDKCKLCRGTAAKAKHIVITVHGSGVSKFVNRFQQIKLPIFNGS